jgi:succinate-semialdehyde dehydrogenase/glutarate-semialdehyde dehydrogenase
MLFKSINPFDGTELNHYQGLTAIQLANILSERAGINREWRSSSLQKRIRLILTVATQLNENKQHHARMITQEMGKPLAEALAEVDKCVWVCKYYAENAERFLAHETIPTEAALSFVAKDPLGTILGIMPWNFPYWQVFRFAIPTLLAGNTVLLKHAPNTFGCSLLIERLMLQAGLPHGVYQNLIIHHELVPQILSHWDVAGVSLTGSSQAGRSVAALAGQHLKPSLLELGGSNAFIVCDDASLTLAVRTAVNARMRNAGQSCIAAKRLIVMDGIYDAFEQQFVAAVEKLQTGNPMESGTDVGPLARLDLAENLERQLRDSLSMGATLRSGGRRNGALFTPTVVSNAMPGMPVCDEETFGPLAVLIRAESLESAIDLASCTEFGLGLSIFTNNVEKALPYVSDIHDGAVFFNELVKSDPRLPFGGTRSSGYGRELSKEGMLAFVNLKTVYVR